MTRAAAFMKATWNCDVRRRWVSGKASMGASRRGRQARLGAGRERDLVKAALVDARQQLLERAIVHVALELVAGEPHAEPVDLVLRRVRVDLLLAVVLQRALERQRLDAAEARGVELLHVRIKRLEERVVDERLVFLLGLLLGLLLALARPRSSLLALALAGVVGRPRARRWRGRRPRACAWARAGRPPRGSTGSRVGVVVPPWKELW